MAALRDDLVFFSNFLGFSLSSVTAVNQVAVDLDFGPDSHNDNTTVL